MAIKIGNKEIVDGDDHATFDNIIIGKQDLGYAIRVGNRGLPGSVSGYNSAGYSPPGYSNVIDKFPFSADFTTSTNVASLTQSRSNVAGQSSSTHGYNSGGHNGPSASDSSFFTTIDKFPFYVDADASGVGNLTQSRSTSAGQSSGTHGYTSGGRHYVQTTSPPTPSGVETIDKFPFATDDNASDVGDLTLARESMAGQSSETHGYASGGNIPPYISNLYYNIIEKFPFATDADSTDVGNLTQTRGGWAGQSSYTHGYTSGGKIGPGHQNSVRRIDKFPFTSDADATIVGDLIVTRYLAAGQSSTTYGYTSAGYRSPNYRENTIDKFSFATDADATDVGNLYQRTSGAAGQQV